MKKLFPILLLCGNMACAATMINQQYVTAAPTTAPQLQNPFNSAPTKITSNTPQNAVQNQPNPNPTAIYTSPSQTQQTLQTQQHNSMYTNPQQQNPYQQNPYQQNPYQRSPYQQQPYQQQPYQQQPYQQQPYQQQPYQQRPYQQQPYQQQPYQQQPYQQQPYQQQPSQQQPYQQQPSQQQGQQNSQWQTRPEAVTPQMPIPNNPPQGPQQPAVQQPLSSNTVTPNSAPVSANSYDPAAQQAWFSNCMKAVTSKEMTPYANAFCQCGWEKITSGGLDPSLLTSPNPADSQKANAVLQKISQQCLVQVMQRQSTPAPQG